MSAVAKRAERALAVASGAVVQSFTVADARRRAREVRRLAAEGDHERAHALEDALHRDALAAIALGHLHAVKLAHAAVETTLVKFPRRCA